MKHNKINMIVIATLVMTCLMLASGCGGFIKGRNDPISGTEFQKGTAALSMKFMENSPPNQVFVGNDFSIGIRVKNEGAYSIENDAEIAVSVPDESAFHFREGKKKSITLVGKSQYIPEGEETLVFFPVKALCYPGISDEGVAVLKNYTPKIKVTACYDYETSANANVCVDTRKYSREVDEKTPCVMSGVTLSGGQGGPVGVTMISPQIIPLAEGKVKLQLGVKIEKLAGEDIRIFHPDYSGACPALEFENQVAADVTMGTAPMFCEPALVQLTRQGTTITCSREMPTSAGTYTTPVTVRLRYNVYQSLLKTLSVSPAGGQPVDCAAILP